MEVTLWSLIILSVSICFADKTAFSGHKVYTVTPKTLEQANVLKGLEEYHEHVDFWSNLRALDRPVDIMVAPAFQTSFNATLQKHGIEFAELIPNVADVLEKERISQLAKTFDVGSATFDKFMNYYEIKEYLRQSSFNYMSMTTLYIFGQTYEGRDMYMLKISTGPNKPAILIDGGIHAREWIAPATVIYVINQLLENEDNRHLLDEVDWYLIPSMNPDGYEYTHADTQNRMWRKTRSAGNQCDGVDCNRNFNYHWKEDEGASDSECNDAYRGPNAMSEKEAQAFDAIFKKFTNIKLYLSFHSYGQYIMYSWAYTHTVTENAAELQKIGEDVNEAIRAVRGTTYEVGQISNTLYIATGSTCDYVMGLYGINLSFTIELPRGGALGFNPPAEDIFPVVTETWEGVKVLHDYVANLDK